MKKTYENPVAEKIVFDYTNTVTASGSLPTMYAKTTDKKCVVILEEPALFCTPTTICNPK